MFKLKTDWLYAVKPYDIMSDNTLRIEISRVLNTTNKPLALYFALDVSKSMAGEKLQKAKEVITKLIDRLSEETYSISTFSNTIRETTVNDLGSINVSGVTRTDLALDWLNSKMLSGNEYTKIGIILSDGGFTDEYGKMITDTSAFIKCKKEIQDKNGLLFALCFGNEDISIISKVVYKTIAENSSDDICNDLINAIPNNDSTIYTIVLNFNKLSDVDIQDACILRPNFSPLHIANGTELTMTNIQNGLTVLLNVKLNSLGFGEEPGIKDIMNIDLKNIPDSKPHLVKLDYRVIGIDGLHCNESVKEDKNIWDSGINNTSNTKNVEPPVTPTNTSSGFGVD